MKKYIRTKDGIYDFHKITIIKYMEKYFVCPIRNETFDQHRINEHLYIKEKYEIIKNADTIEELCDCFVKIKRKRGCKDFILKHDFRDLPLLKEQYVKYPDSPVYGAIHIEDKGLIYVAKMKGVLLNGEIDWELL